MPLDGIQPPNWTVQEQWIWKQICAGEVADLNRLCSETLNPGADDETWQEQTEPRHVSERFLLDVLTDPRYANAVPHRGLRITSAWFPSSIDLSGIEFAHPIQLHHSRFDGKLLLSAARIESSLSFGGSLFKDTLDLSGARIGGQLDASGVAFKADLDMRNLQVEQGLFMRDTACGGRVVLSGATIGGRLDASSVAFKADLALDNVRVERGLLLRDTACGGHVVLSGARIGGQLITIETTFSGVLDMRNLQVEQGLLMRDTACWGHVVLSGATIGGRLDASSVAFKADLALDNLRVEQDVLLVRAICEGPVLLSGARIGGRLVLSDGTTCERDVILVSTDVAGDLDLSDAAFKAVLDASGMTVGGDLRLGPTASRQTRWGANSRFLLRSARVSGIQDHIDEVSKGTRQDAWPPHLELDGFSYKSLGGSGGAGSANTIARSTAWYLDWLRRDDSFSSQPYQHLAEVLRMAGAYSKANDILYASREQERIKAFRDRDWPRYFGLSVLSYTYGYGLGLRSFRILTWVAAFTTLGAVILWTSDVAGVKERGFWWCMWASFDWLLPVVELNPEHADLITKQMKHWRLDWFYMQALIGLTIAGFLTAGLTGFTTTMGFSGAEPRSKS